MCMKISITDRRRQRNVDDDDVQSSNIIIGRHKKVFHRREAQLNQRKPR